ncbi:MAG: protein-L-isoaspartate(D-aspartate) O-methyltransferase [Chloroflexota bacterium]|nr:protein-L-isoaspartate(D-aspartate) O-methyltransferase [Chloroflexota bacterium]MBI5702242.1 protein-L-isoaspartate(D-aspartate) O-methyltransferase [Chloroflexota bacterium]
MEQNFVTERRLMVERQLRGRGISDRRVLDAFEAVPRHLFVPEEYRHLAYEDGPLPIGFGQTISQPFIVAYMTQLLDLTGKERVLEVGTGSGYQAAILSALTAEVHTIELIPALAERARATLAQIGVTNVSIHIGDGSLGWEAAAPYDAILVTAAGPRVPPPLLKQLADGGRMVLPVGERGAQVLELWRREGEQFSQETLLPVAFVPLRGKEGLK